MNKTLNKTIVIGRLGNDPELHTGGKADYCKFTLGYSTIKDGAKEIQWHQIAAFGKQAKACSGNLHKGDLCCIEGRVDSTVIIAERITFLSHKRPCDPSET